jgi:hypothetical protein
MPVGENSPPDKKRCCRDYKHCAAANAGNQRAAQWFAGGRIKDYSAFRTVSGT